MADTYRDVTSESWFSRIFDSIKSVLVGVVFFLISFPILFFNEGRAVRRARSLAEGAGVVVSVPASSVDPAHDGKLVHLSGDATTSETLVDPEFGVMASAIKLIRSVDMYQWKEEKRSEERKKIGGGTETVTVYDYTKNWSSSLVSSTSFQNPAGHENPGSFPVPQKTFVASKVTIGAFRLPDALVDLLDKGDDVPLGENAGSLPGPYQGRVKRAGAGYFMGVDPAAPAVGDVRIAFKAVRPAAVSLVARQAGASFAPYETKAGGSILLLKYGTLGADAMFQAAQRENSFWTWGLRGLGFFLMFLGLVLIVRPVSVVADLIPLFGTLIGAGTTVFAGLTAAVLSLVTVAFSWLFFRPVLGTLLLVGAAVMLVLLIRVGIGKRQTRARA